MAIEVLKNAQYFSVGSINNQTISGSTLGSNNMGGIHFTGTTAHSNNISRKDCDGIYLYPTPKTTPSTMSLSSRRSSSGVESHGHPSSPVRPKPIPLQTAQASAVLPAQNPSPTETQSATPVLSPVPPPEYKFGIIRALDAQAHLTDKTLETIGKLLKKTRKTITAGRWIAQVGFMHDRKEFRDVFQHEGLYSTHNQIIIVTVLSSSSISQGRCDRLGEEMSVVLGGFYGLLVWKRTVAVMRPSRAHKVSKGVTLFGEESGVSEDGTFQMPALDPTHTSISIAASNNRAGHASYLHTQVRYKERAEHEGLRGSRTVEVSDLTFKGPAEYELRKASFQVIGDAPCDFQNIVPRPRGLVDIDGQYKETSQDSKTESKTATLGVEASQSGARATGNVSMTVGESHSTSRDTMRNGIAIIHDTDVDSTIITYIPAHPEHDKTQLTVSANDLPKVTVCPANAGSELGTVTIRTLSTWRVKQLTARAPSFGRRTSALCGLKYKAGQLQHRKDAEIVFCTEVVVPRGTIGLNSVSPRMNDSF